MLKLINISYKIDSKIIIEDINLEFNNGLYALIGLNGAGKTTLINIITTLKSPTKGDIIYNKKSALENPLILRENLGYMSQNIGLIQDFTVFQNIYYFGLLKGCERKTLKINILEILKDFQLDDYKNQKVKNLSGGQKQKIAFIISIINSPKLLILDEPVNNLDYIEREKMYLFLNELSKSCIIIISTHLVDEISQFRDHKVIVSNGLAFIEN